MLDTLVLTLIFCGLFLLNYAIMYEYSWLWSKNRKEYINRYKSLLKYIDTHSEIEINRKYDIKYDMDKFTLEKLSMHFNENNKHGCLYIDDEDVVDEYLPKNLHEKIMIKFYKLWKKQYNQYWKDVKKSFKDERIKKLSEKLKELSD